MSDQSGDNNLNKIPAELLAANAALMESLNRRVTRLIGIVCAVSGGEVLVEIDPPPARWEIYIATRLAEELKIQLGWESTDSDVLYGAGLGFILFNPDRCRFEERFAPEVRAAFTAMREVFVGLLVQGIQVECVNPTSVGVKVFEGIALGAKASLVSEWRGFKNRNTELFICLLIMRDEVLSRSSTTELHQYLNDLLGGKYLPDLESFQRLCRRIGLRLRKPGGSQKKGLK